MAENVDNISSANLDTQLLNRTQQEESAEKSGSLREAKKSSSATNSGENYLTEEPTSLRQAVVQKNKLKEKQEKSKGSVGKKITGIRNATSALLRSAWVNLISSFGLTLLYIDFHVFANKVFGDGVFCPVGEEWFDKPGVSWEKGGGELGKKIKAPAATVEKTGLGCLNFGCLLIIIIILVIIGALMEVIKNPVASFFKGLWYFIWDVGVKAIVSIFS